MNSSELIKRYGIPERGNMLIAKSNLTAQEIADFKNNGWVDDSDPEYIILVGGAKA